MNTRKINILIAEDNPLLAESLAYKLKNIGHITTCGSPERAIKTLGKNHFDIAFIDLSLEEEFDGLEILKESVAQGIYSVILSGHEGEEQVTMAYELGCQDYYIKGDEDITIEQVINKFLLIEKDFRFESFIQNTFITNDPDTKNEILHLMENTYTNVPVLILGPTGTGKSLLAKELHAISNKNKPFVELNCATIPENLLESELFGHEKGSFTGATKNKTGLLSLAHDGILFLDEIGSLPLALQAKLLKAIEEKIFLAVGGTEPIKSNFRVISATCDNIVELLGQKKFRMDLYYRLSGINIKLKPLTERPNDIEILLKHFLKQGPRKIILRKSAREILLNYSWPGNVRELEKVVRILKGKNKGIIEARDLPLQLLSGENPAMITKDLLTPIIRQHALAHGMGQTIKQLKAEIVSGVLNDHNQKVNKTLKALRISSNTYYSSIKDIQNKSGDHYDAI